MNNIKSTNKKKMSLIEFHFKRIMEIIGLDLKDDSLKGTPKRIANMYINEIFSGLDLNSMPKISSFKNNYKYNQILVEKNIVVYSTCEHHFLPIIGHAHVGYISNGNVIGISKINRIVDYLCKRPQVQEKLTIQIVKLLQKILQTKNVACLIKAKHLCVNSRGVRDFLSSTITSEFGGEFNKNESKKNEFYNYIRI